MPTVQSALLEFDRKNVMALSLCRTLSVALLSGVACAMAAWGAVVGPGSGVVGGASPATVIEVNPHGIGHVNLVPYYTVQSGFDTYINITNTDIRNGKALKVRFRAGGTGERMLDFTLLLAPGDNWSTAVTLDKNAALARLAYGDSSCTLPTDVRVTFGAFPSVGSPDPQGDTREGFVEVITMADIPRTLPSGNASPLFEAIKAPLNVGSCAAGALAPLAADPLSYADARSKGLEVPTAGILTQWTLINVPRAVSYTGRATALEARAGAGGPSGFGNIVMFPQTGESIANLATVRAYTSDPALRGGAAYNDPGHGVQSLLPPDFPPKSSDFPDLSTPYLPQLIGGGLGAGAAPKIQAYLANQALSVSSFANEFVLEPSIAAKTDWVVTLPTRHLSVSPGYFLPSVALAPAVTDLTRDDSGAPISAVAANFFQTGSNTGGSGVPLELPCTWGVEPYTPADPLAPGYRASSSFDDRDGASANLVVDSADSTAQPFPLCGQTALLRFAKPGADASGGALGAAQWRWNMRPGAKNGWGRVATPGVGGVGLPIIGFAAMELFNSAVSPGIAGVFGQTFPHTMTPAK